MNTTDQTPTIDRAAITAHVVATMPMLTDAGMAELRIALDDIVRRHPRELTSKTLAAEQHARDCAGCARHAADCPSCTAALGSPSPCAISHDVGPGAYPPPTLTHAAAIDAAADRRDAPRSTAGALFGGVSHTFRPPAEMAVTFEDEPPSNAITDPNEPRLGAPLPEPCPRCGKTVRALVDAKGWWLAEKCPACNGSWWFNVPRPVSEIPAVRS